MQTETEIAAITAGPNKNINGIFIALTQNEIAEIAAFDAAYQEKVPTMNQQRLVGKASSALKDSNNVVLFFFGAATPVTKDWVDYRAALSAIISGFDTTSTSLPDAPNKPEGM